MILREAKTRAKSRKYWFWGVLFVYSVALGAVCYIQHRRATQGIIEEDTLPILVVLSLNTLSTTMQLYAIKKMKDQIKSALGIKQATCKIVLYLTMFVS